MTPNIHTTSATLYTTQPVLSLRDVGGNVMTSDSLSTVTAVQVESLSVDKSVGINTQSAPLVKVKRVYTDVLSNTFTAGDSLEVCAACVCVCMCVCVCVVVWCGVVWCGVVWCGVSHRVGLILATN